MFNTAKKYSIKAISWLIALILTLGVIPATAAYAHENTGASGKPVHVAELAQENAYTRSFLNSDGSKTAYQYFEPIAYQNDKGGYTLYDNTIVNSTKNPGYYTNKASDVDVYLPDDLAKNPVIVQDSGYRVEMKPVSTSLGDNLLTDAAAQKIKRSSVDLTGEPQLMDQKEKVNTSQIKSLAYDIQNAATLEYTPINSGVKENIVLLSKPETNRFYFTLSTDGLTPVLDGNNVINLLNDQGDTVFQMAAPFMTDANNTYSDNINLDIQYNHRAGKYIVTLVADKDYLDAAAYPVKIDPTMTKSAFGNAWGYGEKVVNNSDTTQSEALETMPIGNNGTTSYRIFIKPAIYWWYASSNQGPLTNDPSLIENAKLTFYTASAGAALNVDLYDITSPDALTLDAYTWENPGPSNGRWGGVLVGTEQLPTTASQEVSWDITDRFKFWVENGYGEAYGNSFARAVVLYLKASNENINNSRELDGHLLNVNNPSPENASVRPLIILTYIDPTMVNITWDAAGGIVDPAISQLATGISFGNNLPTPEKSGYQFEGWSDGSGTLIGPQTRVPSVDTTYYAFWKKIVTITWDARGGTVTPAKSQLIEGTALGDAFNGSLPEPKRRGYYFGGWYTEPKGEGSLIKPATKVSSSDITYYAYWTRNVKVSNKINNIYKYDKDGDPVSMISGNFTWDYTDFAVYGAEPLKFSRHYDSTNIKDGELGFGWRHDYMYSVDVDEPSAYAMINFPDGNSFAYDLLEENGNSFVEPGGATYTFAEISNGYLMTDQQSQTKYTFDINGNLIGIEDVGGKLTTISRNGDEIASISNDTGTLTFTYENGKIKTITDQTGRSVTYTYDGNGDLKSFLNADGDTLDYTYDGEHRFTAVSDFNGTTYLSNTYDDKGCVASQYQAGQGISYFAYDLNNLVSTITAPDGAVRKYYYDENHNVTAVENVNGQTKYTYDDQGRMLSQTDRLENTTSYTYDAAGNQTSITYPDGTSEYFEYNELNLVMRETAKDGTVTQYTYDDRGNQTSYTDARGNTSRSTYDENNNLLTSTDALGNTTHYTYDSKGNKLTETDPLGNTTEYAYDNQGRLVKETGADGSTTTYVYSDAGKLIKTIDADGNETNIDVSGNGFNTGNTDPMGFSTSTVYNEQNKPVSVTDAMGNTTTYGYDSVGQMISTTDALGNTTRYKYDLAGRMTSMTDPRGNTWTYSYDAESRTIATADPLGNKTSTVYDKMGQTTSDANARGATTSYDYDVMGRTTKTTDALGYFTRSVYDPNGNEIEQYDANGNKWSYVYDANDQMTEAIDPLGYKTTYAYDANGQQTKTVSALGIESGKSVLDSMGREIKSFDAEGNETQYVYDILGRLVKTIYADGTFTTSEYNANGWLVSATAQDGGVTEYTYNKNGQVLTITDAAGGVTTNEYDALGRTVSITDAVGGVTKSAYDANGNLASTTDALGGATSYVYDALNRVTSTTDPLGNVTATEYDENGNVIKITNPDGGEITYEYDLLDRLVSTTDPEGYTVKYTYDGNGNTLATVDGRGNATSTEYDGLDRTVKGVDQLGNSTTTEYDADGRVIKVENAEEAVTNYEYNLNGDVTKVTDALGNSTTTTYDSMGRVATTTDARGAVTAYTYTATGQVKTITDAMGGVKSYEYDLLGNLIKETNELGKSTTYTYDALSRPLTVTNPLGSVDRMAYDAMGRITSVTDKNGNVTKYKYDANGNVVETIDALGHSSYFEYDVMNRLIKVTLYRIDDRHNANEAEVTLYSYDKRGLTTKEINAAGDSTIFVYDGDGNLIQKTDADGYVTQFSQDPRNLVEAINYSDGKQVKFGYNKNGQLVTMTDWNGTVNFALDVLDRIISVNDQNKKTTKYTYDAVGNKTSMTYPDGTVANYTYDLLGRLTNLKDAENQNTVYQYDAASQLIASAKPNGWKENYTYDDAGQLLTQLTKDPSDMTNKAIQHSYSYDPQGNITREARTGAGGQDKYDLTHTYDALNRLTRTTGLWGYNEHTYEYDSLGNLIYEKGANGTTKGNEYFYNNLNQQIKKVTDGKDTTNYTFDKRGNLISGALDKSNTLVEQYVYDATNRMTQGTNSKGEQSRYVYNGQGDLVANELMIEKSAYGYTGVGGDVNVNNKKFSDVIKNYVLDYTSPLKNVIMATESGVGGLTYRYTYGLHKESAVIYGLPAGTNGIMQSYAYPNNPNGTLTSVVKLYYHHDRLGSTDYLTDNVSGKVTSYVTYDDWGALTAKANVKLGVRELDLVQEYTGHPYDQVQGMYYARARMYNAADRRFMARDAIKGNLYMPQSMSAYMYCYNNAVKYVDLTGLTPEVLIGGKKVNNVIEGSSGTLYASINELFYLYFGKYPSVNDNEINNTFTYSLVIAGASQVEYTIALKIYNGRSASYDIDRRFGNSGSSSHYADSSGGSAYSDYYVSIDYFNKMACKMGRGKTIEKILKEGQRYSLGKDTTRLKSKKGKLTLNFSGNYVLEGKGITVNLTGRATWLPSTKLHFYDPEYEPAVGVDYIGVSWGGEFYTEKKHPPVPKVSWKNGFGKGQIPKEGGREKNGGIAWKFDEFYEVGGAGDTVSDYVKTVSFNLKLKKDTFKNENMADVLLTYIHTYEKVKVSASISFSASGVGAGMSLSNVEKQISPEACVLRVPY